MTRLAAVLSMMNAMTRGSMLAAYINGGLDGTAKTALPCACFRWLVENTAGLRGGDSGSAGLRTCRRRRAAAGWRHGVDA